MATTETTVITSAMYEDDAEYVGIAEVTMPSMAFLTQTISGTGIAGEYETVILGQLSAMELGLKMLILSKQAIQLSTPEVHKWEFREVQQKLENSTGALEVTGVKHIVQAVPKSMGGGTIKNNSTSDPEIKASVKYWAEYRDGEKILELDPLNCICYVNGVDYMEKVRQALGK